MRKNLWSVVLMLLSAAAQKFVRNQRQGYTEIAQLKMKLFHLKIIKTCRFLHLSFLGLGVCLVFLLSSMIVFNIALFLYTPCSPEIKMWLGFSLAAIYLLISGAVFSYVFSEDKWLKMFHADAKTGA